MNHFEVQSNRVSKQEAALRFKGRQVQKAKVFLRAAGDNLAAFKTWLGDEHKREHLTYADIADVTQVWIMIDQLLPCTYYRSCMMIF